MTCDCGWSFVHEQIHPPDPQSAIEDEEARRSQATNRLILGAVALVVGILITAVTYSQAMKAGGLYIVAYGPIVFGLITILRVLRSGQVAPLCGPRVVSIVQMPDDRAVIHRSLIPLACSW